MRCDRIRSKDGPNCAADAGAAGGHLRALHRRSVCCGPEAAGANHQSGNGFSVWPASFPLRAALKFRAITSCSMLVGQTPQSAGAEPRRPDDSRRSVVRRSSRGSSPASALAVRVNGRGAWAKAASSAPPSSNVPRLMCRQAYSFLRPPALRQRIAKQPSRIVLALNNCAPTRQPTV